MLANKLNFGNFLITDCDNFMDGNQIFSSIMTSSDWHFRMSSMESSREEIPMKLSVNGEEMEEAEKLYTELREQHNMQEPNSNLGLFKQEWITLEEHEALRMAELKQQQQQEKKSPKKSKNKKEAKNEESSTEQQEKAKVETEEAEASAETSAEGGENENGEEKAK